MNNTPPVVRNLIIFNAVIMLLAWIKPDFMYSTFSLFYIESPFFKPYQFFTHIFMHGNFVHILFNMYTLWLFGSVLASIWGEKKFLFYFLVTGLGAAALHTFVQYLEVQQLVSAINEGDALAKAKLSVLMRTPTVGASGAVYGLLLAFGMLFPNNVLQFIFPPVAIKAKWMVIILGAIALVMGITGSKSNIAHFAHLGGMLFGYLLILYWKKKGKLYY